MAKVVFNINFSVDIPEGDAIEYEGFPTMQDRINLTIEQMPELLDYEFQDGGENFKVTNVEINNGDSVVVYPTVDGKLEQDIQV